MKAYTVNCYFPQWSRKEPMGSLSKHTVFIFSPFKNGFLKECIK